MSEEAPSTLRRLGPAAGLLAVVALVVGPLVARLQAHAWYLHDTESLMVPTVGRELAHGHWGDWIHYQYNLYQGGILVDGALSGLGFALFGDHLLAWKWYALAYALGIALAGMAILRRTSGWPAALALPVLLATAPFVLKDGLITPAGHHVSGTFYALLALAIALGGRRPDDEGTGPGRPGFARGLLAGLVLGLGSVYMRPVVSAGPAVALVLLWGGWRPLLGLALGCLSMPALVALGAWTLAAGVSPYDQWGALDTFRAALWAPRAEPAPQEHFAKLMEALSPPLRPTLFAQPLSRSAEAWALRDIYTVAAHLWSGAWVATPALLTGVFAWLASRREPARARRLAWGTGTLLVLAAGYAATYVASPFRVDEGLVELANNGLAPGLSGPRYVLPVYICLTLGLAHLAGLAWQHRRLRVLGVALILLVAVPGAWAAIVDQVVDADDRSEVAELHPYEYFKMFGPHRGPPPEVHLGCKTVDPVSRANHLRAAGWMRQPSPLGLARDSRLTRQILDQMAREWGLDAQERRFVAHGMGIGLADALHSVQGIRVAGLGEVARRVTDDLGPADGEAFAAGFVAGFPVDQLNELDEQTRAWTCAATSWGTRPLCRLAGRRFAQSDLRLLPDDPAQLLVDPSTLPAGPEAADLVFGVGAELARANPALGLQLDPLDRWPAPLAEAFRAGWQEQELRARWRDGDPWEPRLVP